MSVLDLNSIISQVKTNCNISDAKFWGTYSICGLLMRFRELYRKEQNILPWQQISQKDIAEWIADRENLWQRLSDEDFQNISPGGNAYAPFDVKKINAALRDEGLVYGAGFGAYMKPSFFLAELVSSELTEGYETHIAGNELARDLSAYPAMLQGSTIFARRDALSILLWDKYEEMTAKKHVSALSYAFSAYNIYSGEQTLEDAYKKVLEITERESETYIYHEVGEAFEGSRLGSVWKDMLSDLRNRRVEFFVRGIKDVLSDTSEKGMLKHVIEKDKKGSLGFYVALLGGFRKLIFPEIKESFHDFTLTEDWAAIEKVRRIGYRRAEEISSKIIDIYNPETDNTRMNEFIEKELIPSITPQ
ncbi:MAG: Sfum_1244 family protein [Nitrospirota bacterium]